MFRLAAFFLGAVLIATSFQAHAGSIRWKAKFELQTPFNGINDVHFGWSVAGPNLIDASPLQISYAFFGADWGTIADDGVASTTAGSLDLSNPAGPLSSGSTHGFAFTLLLSDGATPTFNSAYWTTNGFGAGQPPYQIDLKGLSFKNLGMVPVPGALVCLLAGLAGLVSMRLRSLSA